MYYLPFARFYFPYRQGDSLSSIENAVKYNPMYESDATGNNPYCKRYPQLTSYSSSSNETSTEYSSEEIRHIYENSELTKQVLLLIFTLSYFKGLIVVL